MRGVFVNTLVELAATDSRIVFLTADLGFMALEPFAEKFPGRFFNVGVAEENMVGMATGLAEAGFLPFVYSIATFAALRPYEFIRNGPGLQHLPVRIVGVGGGFDYGHNGPSHHALEDVGLLRTQPGVGVIVPADAAQTCTALRKTWNLPGPLYYRLGKDDKLTVEGLDGRFELGRVQMIGEGHDVLILSLGSIATEAVAATKHLRQSGIFCSAGIVSGFNPNPTSDLVDLLTRFRIVITVEAHYRVGGLASLVADVIAEGGLGCRLIAHAVDRPHDGRSGSMAYLHRRHGLCCEAIVATVRDAVLSAQSSSGAFR
jgi:transketolase